MLPKKGRLHVKNEGLFKIAWKRVIARKSKVGSLTKIKRFTFFDDTSLECSKSFVD
jgi:hypothetical protein